MRTALCLLFLIFGTSCTFEKVSSRTDPTVEKLIGQLTKIGEESAGLHSTAWVLAFVAEDRHPEFVGGVIGAEAPKTPLPMRELVRLGSVAVPTLIKHLNDKRPTKLKVGGEFFMFSYFSDEYSPKDPSSRDGQRNHERHFEGRYTVRVGDVCYALIGRIVNRNLWPIRYQPTAGLVVNSPMESPSLIRKVKRDWGDIDAQMHMDSLVADARSADEEWHVGPALQRLRIYYPDEYARQKRSSLKDKIERFEGTEKEPRD